MYLFLNLFYTRWFYLSSTLSVWYCFFIFPFFVRFYFVVIFVWSPELRLSMEFFVDHVEIKEIIKWFCLQVIMSDIDHIVVIVTTFLYVLLHVFRILKSVCVKHLQTGNTDSLRWEQGFKRKLEANYKFWCHVLGGLSSNLRQNLKCRFTQNN